MEGADKNSLAKAIVAKKEPEPEPSDGKDDRLVDLASEVIKFNDSPKALAKALKAFINQVRG